METTVVLSALSILVFLERRPALRFTRSRLLRPFFATDLLYFATAALLSLVMRAQASRCAVSVGLPGVDLLGLPSPVLWLAAVVLYDLGAYVAHELLHRVEALWRLHKIHHSSRTLDWLATFRGHALEHALRHLLSPVLLILLGFPFASVGAAAAIYSVWAAFLHSNVRVPLHALEFLLITPRLHRLHHVPATALHNLGTIFSLWDRLSGRLLVADALESAPLGVPAEVSTYPQTWWRQFAEPFRAAPPLEALSPTR